MSLLGGIRPPIALLSVLLLALAGITALTMGRSGDGPVPKAVLQSQQHFAEDGAVALRASLDESITDLNRTASLFSAGRPVSADTVLDKVGNVYQKWRGSAVLEITSGKLLAARGESVPVTAIDRSELAREDGLRPRLIRLDNGETRLLTLALLSWEGRPQELLVTTSSLKFPGVSLGKFRAIAVVDAKGTVLSSDGILAPEQILSDTVKEASAASREQLDDFAKAAARKASRDPSTTKEPGSGGYLGVSGSLLGDTVQGDRALAGYASLTGSQPGEFTPASELGLNVVTLVHITDEGVHVASLAFGLLAAGALLLIGGLTVALLLGTVQRPIVRLFLESRRLTRGDLTRPVTVPRFGEGARIGTSLERLRRQLLGQDDDVPAARGRFGARSLVAISGALLLVWCIPLVLFVNRAGGDVTVPQQMVSDQRERTDTLADRLRRALNEGHADLTAVGTLVGDRTEPGQITEVLDRTMAEHPRYDALYVLDENGKVVARSGGDVHSPSGKGPSDKPLRVLDDAGKKPVIIGTAEIPGRDGAAVVGEFRVDFLNSLLKRPGLGTVRVVDSDRKVIAGNSGYREFQKLPGRIDELADATNQKVGMAAKPSGVLYRDGAAVQLAGAAPFAGGGAAKELNWTVVSWQPASGLAIPAYQYQNRTVLAGLLGITAAAACLGWLHIVVVRPLRELARQAEALAGGDRRTVLYPRHHDEVGAVARSLELVRQQLQGQRHQQRRQGGAPSATAGAGRNQ
ncbi:HAMP domain-containing protein [Streptomyces sp. SID5785]|uniref:HAMP domain-containing protein n=1 Tax=Streptomyces sp. SID5785 TaxID=2690309 RepID=UPI0013611A8E|nr:cache and HAMP domain-containing protein [Streptomyces sp. SID5785]MZD03580.1 HAMP domain-containing protein [Streptomyces sp. SID5785]MZD03678.1 HAMP domain-containing protein [Streptomyces sp. SID5785]